MNTIKATWTNGRIVPAGPVDWPEGSELRVEPVSEAEKIGMPEEAWRDDAESIAEWVAAVDRIEPMIWGPGEEEEFRRLQEEHRRFNIDAVRKQMDLIADGDTK